MSAYGEISNIFSDLIVDVYNARIERLDFFGSKLKLIS